jgi:OOP family OmpA-OmpF porin
MKKTARILGLIGLILVMLGSLLGVVLAEEKLIPKVDNFIVLVDQSGSMFMTSQGAVLAKAKLAKDILSAINERTPELGYVGAIQIFPPSKTLIGPQRYARNSFGNVIQNLPEERRIFGNRTPLGEGILDLGEVLKNMPPRKTAIIVLSDGEENVGLEALGAVETMTAEYQYVSFHTVSLAEKNEGKAILEEITRISGGVYVEGSELSSDEMALDRFVKEVFYSVAVALDSDGDGVVDDMDKCPNTPKGVEVDAQGCPLDSDGDGVVNDMDKCPSTPRGVEVDPQGCPLDSDADRVPDYLDKCPNTPKGATVNEVGCWTLQAVMLFDTNSSYMRDEASPLLDEVITILKKNPEIEVEIQGHTDNTGSAEYNQWLSERRAKRVMEYLVQNGIDSERLEAKGYGLAQPVASNATEEGRAQNRRVELKRTQ